MFWNRAAIVANQALANGDLMPIATEPMTVRQNNTDFVVRIRNENMEKKFTLSKERGNPFLPYDDSMYVHAAGDSHVCLLNKFPVLSPHLLICSNEFIEQTKPLEKIDFKAWLLGFCESDVLGFYNSGGDAGASQPHRHMQLVKTGIPLRSTIESGELPFNHKIARFEELDAELIHERYLTGMQELELYDKNVCKPHNLLLTSNWLLIVPRSRASLNHIFVNGLNYAGQFLVKDLQSKNQLEAQGILNILKKCSEY
ncbi:phosphorylase [Aliikangiella coralliicola]|uniref:Phosphorylase n=1 Tax=Aliikangiella coralliicola TaxID=2592383 RepID=A0A545U530_9GAMM|nr:phosphorylase [Aliikangiella coralliicola]TQV84577.1 phosphorylase [Aliikangiella coralliicola]